MKCNFMSKRLEQELDNLSLDQLKGAINQGLDELALLITENPRPKDLESQIDVIEDTLKVIKDAITRREELLK